MTRGLWSRREVMRSGTAGLALISTGLWTAREGARADTRADTRTDARADALLQRTARPANFETPLEVFTTRLTPIDRFYVRNHFDMPRIDASTWKLHLTGLVEEPLTLTLAELERMPQVTVEAVLQCAGNGRAFFEPRVPGIQWERGAMGNASWTGVRLSEILKRARPKGEARHVELQGAERPLMSTAPAFIRGISVAKAMHDDTLIALRMNGAPLPRVHGGPARLVVSGWVADDWIKWVERVELRAEEPRGFFYEKGYRFPVEPGAPGAPVKAMRPMDVLVVKSVIGAPAPGAVLTKGRHEVKGVAFSGGGHGIAQVEVSLDGGTSWKRAALERGGRYGFTVFALPFEAKPGRLAIRARATDTAGATQPAAPVWNPAGYLYNAIDGVDVEVRA